MRTRYSRRSVPHLPPHGSEPRRSLVALGVIAVTLSLSGCMPPPSTPTAPTATPAPTTGLGGYDDLARACAAMTDDVITLRTIRGSAEIGLDQEGAEAILTRLGEMRSLAPSTLSDDYRAVERAIERLIFEIDAPPTTGPSGRASPAPGPTPTRTPTSTPAAHASVSDLVDSAAGEVKAWLRDNCDDV